MNSQNPTKSPLVAARRRQQAFALRTSGMAWSAVGEHMGITATAAQLLALRHVRATGEVIPSALPTRMDLTRAARERLDRQSQAVRLHADGHPLVDIAAALSTSPSVASRLLRAGSGERHREARRLLQAREDRRLNAQAAQALHRAGLTWGAVAERLGRAAVYRARRTPKKTA